MRRTVWAAAILGAAIVGHAAAQATNDYIYCSVYLTEGDQYLAVDLPENYGSNTVWQIGEVPAGGVADTWFDDDVHGSFRVRNSGDTKADIWIVAEDDRGDNPFEGMGLRPTGALPTFDRYALACATNVEDLLPDWRLLDQVFSPDEVGAVLGRTLAGDYLLFDLKFYAPESPPSGAMNDYRFRIGFYAAPWDGTPPSL